VGAKAPAAAPAKISSPATASPSFSAEAAPLPVAAPLATGEVDLAGLWQNVLEATGRASAFTRSYLVDAHPISLVKNVLTIGFDPEFRDQLELVNNQKTQSLLQTKLQELGHPNVQIRFIVAEAPNRAAASAVVTPPPPPGPAVEQVRPAPMPAPPKPAKPSPSKVEAQDFKNDPLILKALEIFKGQIVEVRA